MVTWFNALGQSIMAAGVVGAGSGEASSPMVDSKQKGMQQGALEKICLPPSSPRTRLNDPLPLTWCPLLPLTTSQEYHGVVNPSIP
jgi:hypothetical protein